MNPQIAEELNALYLNKQFSDYIDKLQEHKSDINEAVFHYNLGTAYLKMEEVAWGRFYLEKAKTFGIIDSRLNRNLDYTRLKLSSVDIDNGHSLFERNISFFIGLDIQHYLFAFLLSLLILTFWWRKFTQRKLITFMAIIAVSSLVFIPSFSLKGHAAAIVMKETSLREGPSKAFEQVRSVEKGLKVIIGKSDGKWRLVRYPLHLSGWILAMDIKVL